MIACTLLGRQRPRIAVIAVDPGVSRALLYATMLADRGRGYDLAILEPPSVDYRELYALLDDPEPRISHAMLCAEECRFFAAPRRRDEIRARVRARKRRRGW